MGIWDIVWISVLGIAGIIEGYAIGTKAKGDTLSERTRYWFRTSTPGGKAGFTLTWVGFAVWFLGHILGWWS